LRGINGAVESEPVFDIKCLQRLGGVNVAVPSPSAACGRHSAASAEPP
jgi:hypothetical protein